MGELLVNPESLNHNANILLELAGLLGAGRPDHDLSRRGSAPASPDDLSAALRSFVDFAADQYQDLVAVLAALSTKLKHAATAYDRTDKASAQRIDAFLGSSRYVPPQER